MESNVLTEDVFCERICLGIFVAALKDLGVYSVVVIVSRETADGMMDEDWLGPVPYLILQGLYGDILMYLRRMSLLKEISETWQN